MIHCLEFRRLATADPNYDDDAFRVHIAECNSCARFQESMCAFDARLKKALEVPVPLDLAIASAGEPNRERRRKPLHWFAAVATVLVSTALGVGLWLGTANHSLADDVLAHMYAEPQLLLPPSVPFDSRLMAAVMNTIDTDITLDDAQIAYAGLCEFRGRLVAHIVLKGDSGPVMVLLLPAEGLPETLAIHDSGFDGIIRPVGQGSIALVGRNGEPVDQMAIRLARAVSFNNSG